MFADEKHTENEINSFYNASQVVDIDLIDYHEISLNGDQVNISAIDSYFRKWSSLENVNFMPKKKTKPEELNENDLLCSTDLFPSCREMPLNVTSTCSLSTASIRTSHHPNNYSVHFTVTRYSPFSFDFFHIRNLSDCTVTFSTTFVNEKRLPSSLTVHENKLQCLAGDSIRPANMATFIPLETGAYTIKIYVFPLWKKSGANRYHQNTSASSATLVRCHLNVIDVPIPRPLSNLNGSPVIKLSSFSDLPTHTDVLFRLSDKQSGLHVKPYTVLFELNRHSELITFSSDAPHMPTAIKWHFVNLWTCFITFWQASDFVLPIQAKCNKDVDTTPVVLSISTSNCGKALYRLADYQIILNVYPTVSFKEALSRT